MGGISNIIMGTYEMFDAEQQERADKSANALEYKRTKAQAEAAVEGARAKGSYESGKQRLMGAQLAGKQKQAYTASGVDATQGTAAAVQADSAALVELDAKRTAINAAREVYGYQETKRQAYQEMQAKNANATNKAVGAALGGYTKSLSGWLSMGDGGKGKGKGKGK